jgi:hypothetical protein
MRTTSACSVAIVMSLAAAACSTITVSTDYDRAVDFTRFASFELRTGQSLKNPLMRDRIEAALVRELESKGLTRAAGRPDLWVSAHVRMSNEKQIDTTRFGYRWGRWGYWGGGTAVTTVRKVPVGTLIVDLVDAERKELVWQGVASDAIDPGADAAARDKAVAAMIATMLKDYPPAAR